MANISLQDIKTLRERLGTGMVDTKKALEEAEGDIEKAVEILRLKGAKGNAKRADRSTSEGLIAAAQGSDYTTLIELACETDFVAKNERFIALSETVLAAVHAAGASNVAEALAAPAEGGTVATTIDDAAAIIGEKVELRQVAKVSGDNVEVYLHRTSQDLPPQIGVAVAYTGGDKDVARSVAQHISFANPPYLSKEDVPAEEVDRERELVREISLSEGKPESQLEKIVEGRLGAFFKQVALLEQEYAKDPKFTVAKVLEDAGVTVTGYVRFKVGA